MAVLLLGMERRCLRRASYLKISVHTAVIIMDGVTCEENGRFPAWDGKGVPW
jgi:hypothetical protein